MARLLPINKSEMNTPVIWTKYLNTAIALLTALVVWTACRPAQFNEEAAFSSRSLAEEPEDVFSEEDVFRSLLNKTACKDFDFHVWSYIYKIVSMEKGKPPPYYTVKEKIMKQVSKQITKKQVSEETIRKFAMRFVEIYAYITEFMQKKKQNDSAEILVQLEHGIIHPKHHNFTHKLQNTLAELSQYAQQINKNCEESPSPLTKRRWAKERRPSIRSLSNSIAFFEDLKRTHNPLVYGAFKVMSTAYQSCSVLNLPFMPPDHEARGVEIYGRHPLGGWQRKVVNLSALNSSHYYIKQTSSPNPMMCFDVQANPLIYDFGGKPFVSAHSIDLFKNDGGGAPGLGIDCSGFVTAAFAGAGLKLKQNIPIRPIHIKGISSHLFKRADKYNLSCLQKQELSARNPLQPGDIIASSRHIAIVDTVGADPFNINSRTNIESCHSSKIRAANFNFSIIQSSAHNSAGINRMHISEAFDHSSSFGLGLQKTAAQLCAQKFGQKAFKNIPEISILRHLSDNPACLTQEIYLKHQECLRSCPPADFYSPDLLQI